MVPCPPDFLPKFINPTRSLVSTSYVGRSSLGASTTPRRIRASKPTKRKAWFFEAAAMSSKKHGPVFVCIMLHIFGNIIVVWKSFRGITEWLKTMVVVVSRWMKGDDDDDDDDDDDVDDSDNFNDPNWKWIPPQKVSCWKILHEQLGCHSLSRIASHSKVSACKMRSLCYFSLALLSIHERKWLGMPQIW